MQNARLDESQARIKTAWRNINNLRCRWHHPCGRMQRGIKEPLDESISGEWKFWLKTQLSKTENHGTRSHHFMENRCGNNRNSDSLYFLGSKITADSGCSDEIKRCLLVGWKAVKKARQHIKKQRHQFANKGPSSQSYGFLEVMYQCESWAIKKAEHWRIDAFELWHWRRLLRVPWTARSNQSILKEINPKYSLEGLMLNLKL